jgi:DNA repair ATPase RecN
MTDDNLSLLTEQNARILDVLRNMHVDNQDRDKTLKEVSSGVAEVSIAVAALSADLKEMKATVEDISERLQTVEGRLNAVWLLND